MLGRMPTPQVVALLKASGPAQAAVTLLTFPEDRIDALLAAMEPADLAGVLAASTPGHRRELLASMTPDKTLQVIAVLTPRQFADVVAALPATSAARLLDAAPAPLAGRILAALPEITRVGAVALITPQRADELAAARYDERVLAAVVRIAPRVSRLPWRTCDLVAAVLHRAIHIAVRYHGDRDLVDEEIHEVALATNWSTVAGLMIVTDAKLTDDVVGYGAAIEAAGYPFELLRWTSENDDGALKRALVRLAG